MRIIFSHKENSYEVMPWREGLEIRNITDGTSKFIYGIDFNSDGSVSALNGDVYSKDRLVKLLIKMLDADTTDLTAFVTAGQSAVIAAPVYCPACKNVFWIDDTNIPVGEKDEAVCPKCKAVWTRKRI